MSCWHTPQELVYSFWQAVLAGTSSSDPLPVLEGYHLRNEYVMEVAAFSVALALMAPVVYTVSCQH